MFIACNLFVFLLTLWSKPAYAFIELDNQFVAREACEALQSIRSGTNPKYSVDSRKTYPVIGKTKIALHYLLRSRVLNASSLGTCTVWTTLGSSAPVEQDYLLALSWQPSL